MVFIDVDFNKYLKKQRSLTYDITYRDDVLGSKHPTYVVSNKDVHLGQDLARDWTNIMPDADQFLKSYGNLAIEQIKERNSMNNDVLRDYFGMMNEPLEHTNEPYIVVNYAISSEGPKTNANIKSLIDSMALGFGK